MSADNQAAFIWACDEAAKRNELRRRLDHEDRERREHLHRYRGHAIFDRSTIGRQLRNVIF
jgi:hypothetical protein